MIVCAEMDEQWGYVGAKSRQRWLFYAYDRIRRTVVAHVFGERTLATLEGGPQVTEEHALCQEAQQKGPKEDAGQQCQGHECTCRGYQGPRKAQGG
ncbi:hypothetical protein E3AUHO_50530 [Klebsiella pneumoniae subsp. pneumoniae]|nr:hypothetical protein E3AUHO_50530 [Klebsiella pneumoniae subsp. pneumoniae]